MRGKYLIGITGVQGSGKNTVADIIKEIWPHRVMDVKRSSFAYFLKKALHVLFNVDERLLFEGTSEQKNNTVIVFGKTRMPLRVLMQKFGTEALKNFSPTIHIDQLVDRIINDDASIIAIPDVRFADEAAFVKKHKGILVRVERSSAHSMNASHLSEVGIPNIKEDVVINNNGNMDMLYEEVCTKIAPLVTKTIFNKKIEGYTPVNIESVDTYVKTGTWKEIPMNSESFYVDMSNDELLPLLGFTNDGKEN